MNSLWNRMIAISCFISNREQRIKWILIRLQLRNERRGNLYHTDLQRKYTKEQILEQCKTWREIDRHDREEIKARS